jgi:hypothetical protein
MFHQKAISMPFQTREELKNKINKPPHSYYSLAMKEVFKQREEVKTVAFHSDVYYLRSALEKHTGFVIPLPLVEKAMRAEGWYEGVVNRRKK